jgi:glycosyltransferase involved in cell wall biosynthesis/ubiquinone/menaquinone biosynthesis C-methylase UbiE
LGCAGEGGDEVKVLLNAASVKEGGPLVVLDQLLKQMRQLRVDIDWAVAMHPSVHLHQNEQRDFSPVDVGDIDANPFGVLRWYEVGLPAAVERLKTDLVFSITNYLPLRRLAVPTVLLVQHAGHFSERFDDLTRQHLRRPDRVAAWVMKRRWVERSVRTASEVTVQTTSLADAIAMRTGRPRDRIHAIPHGPGTVTPVPPPRRNQTRRPVRIGYVTKWGVQKNFEVLFEAAARLIGQGRAIRIILTLAADLPENVRIIRRAKAAGLGAMLENAGELDAAGISALYDSLDIFVFPSLVESFGFPLVEAMAKGLPIVAAETPSNREVAGDAGLFFPPTDADALARSLGQIIDNASLREAKSASAFHRAQNFSWNRAAEQTAALFDTALRAASHRSGSAQLDRMLLDTSLQNRTRRHYDSHPFDAITPEDELRPRNIQPRPFIEFCEQYLKRQMSVAEIGCGPGRGTMFLTASEVNVTAVDISAPSLVRARKRAPNASFVRATTMALPFDNECFDVVVSDGVIHHTPNARAAFLESVRVLRPGGYLYLGIYNRRRHYYYIYTYAGPPIRWLERSAAGRWALSMTLIPLYYLAHLAKSRGRRTWEGAKNFFYDYIITPQATFYTREEVMGWGEELGLDLIRHDPWLGNVHVFVFGKPINSAEGRRNSGKTTANAMF